MTQPVGEIIPWNSPAEKFVEKICYVKNNISKYKPRKWVEENASFELFSKKWNDFISQIDKSMVKRWDGKI